MPKMTRWEVIGISRPFRASDVFQRYPQAVGLGWIIAPLWGWDLGVVTTCENGPRFCGLP